MCRARMRSRCESHAEASAFRRASICCGLAKPVAPVPASAVATMSGSLPGVRPRMKPPPRSMSSLTAIGAAPRTSVPSFQRFEARDDAARLRALAQHLGDLRRGESLALETPAELFVAVLRPNRLELGQSSVDALLFIALAGELVDDRMREIAVDAVAQQIVEQAHAPDRLAVEDALHVELRVRAIVDIAPLFAYGDGFFDRRRLVAPIAQFLPQLRFREPLTREQAHGGRERRRCRRRRVHLAPPACGLGVLLLGDRIPDAAVVRGAGLGFLHERPDLVLELFGQLRMLLEIGFGVLAALADARLAIGIPRARLADDVLLQADVDERTGAADAFAVRDVELSDFERRRDLVLDHFDARARADDVSADFDGLQLADVQTHRRVELERAAAAGGFRVAEHDADLLTDLVDEHHRRLGLADRRGELAQSLRHESRLQADVRIAHVAFDLRFGDQRGDGVDHDDVDRVGTHEHLGDVKRLLARIRLRDKQIVQLHSEVAGIRRIERMLDVDEGGDASALLRLSYAVQGQGRLAR